MTDSSDFPTSLGGATILLRRERDEARAEVDRLKRERDEAREQVRSLTERLTRAETVEARALKHMDEATAAAHRLSEAVRSLTVERDQWKADRDEAWKFWKREQGRADEVGGRLGQCSRDLAEALARLSRAREALGSFDENPPPYRAGHLVEGEWRIHQARALAALRAALAEPPANG